MKAMFILFLAPLLLSAQEPNKAASYIEVYDWLVEGVEGCVMTFSNNAINFEEQWMQFSPVGLLVTAKDGSSLSLQSLDTPFWAEVSYFKKGTRVYIRSLRFMKKLTYNEAGQLVDAQSVE